MNKQLNSSKLDVDIKRNLFQFSITRIVLILTILTFYSLLPFNQTSQQINYYFEPSKTVIGELLSAWDGQWYSVISTNWYQLELDNDPGLQKFMFFPLYPLLIRALNILHYDSHLNGIIISLLASLGSVILLYKLALLDFSNTVSRNTVLFWLINPASIFFIAVYSESLFLFLSLGTFYFFRQKKWFLSGLFGLLSGFTRIQGVLLIIPLLIETISELRLQKNITKNIFVKLFPTISTGIGLLLFVGIAYNITGNPQATLVASKHFQNENPSIINGFMTVVQNYRNFFQLPTHSYLYSKIDLTFFTVFFLSLLAMRRKIRPSYIVYALLIVILPILSGKTTAAIRYYSISFPHYLLLAILIDKYPQLKSPAIITSAILMGLFSIMFVNWFWVA